MSWQARTMSAALSIGTVFHLLESPQIPGAPGSVAPGDNFHIIDTNEKWIKMEVLSAASDLIVLTSTTTGEMHLAPIDPTELGSNISSPGMASSEWKRIS